MIDKSKNYFKNLDSLRFLAFLAVFISHLTYFLNFPSGSSGQWHFLSKYIQVGDVAVWFFFTLSGFLITYLLLKEKESTGTISVKKFYLRRILRIWPAYFTAIIFAIIISILSNNIDLPYRVDLSWNWIIPFFVFVGNVSRAFYGAVNEMLSVLWSIAVEEQFYLIWPVLVLIFKKRIKYVIWAGILISIVFRAFIYPDYDIRSFFTLSVMSSLLIGSWCALEFDRIKSFSNSLAFKYIRLLSPFIIIFFLWFRCLFVEQSLMANIFLMFEQIIFALLFVCIISDQAIVDRPLLPIFGKYRFINFLGKISYGLYVYHLISLTIVLTFVKINGTMTVLNFLLYFILTLALTFIMAIFSYRYIEKPFMLLKEKQYLKNNTD